MWVRHDFDFLIYKGLGRPVDGDTATMVSKMRGLLSPSSIIKEGLLYPVRAETA